MNINTEYMNVVSTKLRVLRPLLGVLLYLHGLNIHYFLLREPLMELSQIFNEEI